MGRYEDRLNAINSLLQDAIILNKKLNYLKNHANVKNARDVSEFANRLSLQIGVLSYNIPADLRARWITSEEYEILKDELENAKSILKMLGVEG